MPNTVNRRTADIVYVYQSVRTLLRFPQSLPKRRVYNHSITTTMVFSNHILDNSHNNDYNRIEKKRRICKMNSKDFRKELETMIVDSGGLDKVYDMDLEEFSENLRLNIADVPPLYRYTPADYWNIRNFELSQLTLTPISRLNDIYEGGNGRNSLIMKNADFAFVKSFSEEKNDLLMWAHYADGSRGFCVKYDIGILPESERVILNSLFPVIYNDNYVPKIEPEKLQYEIRRYKSDSSDETNAICKDDYFYLQDVLPRALIKRERWQYEQEWRIVIDLLAKEQRCSDYEDWEENRRPKIDDNGAIPFDCATEVILGKRMEQGKKQHINEIVDRLNENRKKENRTLIDVKE